MKTAMKKLFSLVLVAVLLVGVMPFQAFAAEPVHIYVELEPGRYTINEDFVKEHYTGSGTPSKYYVHEKGFPGDSFELGEKTTVLLVIEEFASVEPTVCGNCGSTEHANCDRVHCDKCGWGDHATDAHCGECGEIECVCEATVMVQINNGTHDGSFKITVGKDADDVYAAYKASNLAALHEGAHGPIVTLDDGVTPMNTTEAGKTYYLWLTWDEPVVTPEPEPEPTPDSSVCTVCGAEVINGMCTGCYLDMGDCTCKQTTTPENNRGKVNLILDYNYKGAKNTTMKVDQNAKVIDLIAGIPAPTRDGHLFSHWTMDEAGEDLIDNERVTDKGTTIYAQWDDDLAVGGKLTVHVNLNYDRKMGTDLTNIVKGTKMGDVLDYVNEPTRWNHKFVGWYWDKDCKDDVESSDRVYKNCTIYAKWEYRQTNNETMLKIYLNGNTKSVAKIVDMYEYSKDGKITMSEVKEAVKQYYTAKNSDGLSYDGLFEAHDWSNYVSNPKRHDGSNSISINRNDDTTVYVMVHNAKVRTSSSSGTADSSNPKTGDMIFNAVTVMGASAACLAALFYLNKKRAV